MIDSIFTLKPQQRAAINNTQKYCQLLIRTGSAIIYPNMDQQNQHDEPMLISKENQHLQAQNQDNIFSYRQQIKPCFYTYDLDPITRQELSNIFDTNGTWHLIAQYFLCYDNEVSYFIQRCHLRGESPRVELLAKLDAINTRVSDLCLYLKSIKNFAAYELLKPFDSIYQDQYMQEHDQNQLQQQASASNSLAMMDEQINWCVDNNLQAQQHIIPEATGCHRNKPEMQFRLHAPTQSLKNKYRKDMKRDQVAFPAQNDIIPLVEVNPANRNVFQKKKEEQLRRSSILDKEIMNQLKLIMQIQYSELRLASDNFNEANVLGNGGFASVYRGKWKGTDVAIKRLKCNLMNQAMNELTMLNSYRIDNVLPIYGISVDGPEACLVYQFMANGSLEDRLACKKNTKPLSWRQRASIAEDVAKALFYLHTLRLKPLVHGDVKSANILLDSQFVAKLGDFGLARQMNKANDNSSSTTMSQTSRNSTHCTVTSIHGTSVYLPPEYLRHRNLSPAVDVYSYGIVLLEMGTGCRAYDGKRLLLEIVEEETSSLAVGQISYKLKDPRLADCSSQLELKIWLELLIKLGLYCAHRIKRKRPSMEAVLQHLALFPKTEQQILSDSPVFDDCSNDVVILDKSQTQHVESQLDGNVESNLNRNHEKVGLYGKNLRNQKGDQQQLQQQQQVRQSQELQDQEQQQQEPAYDAIIPLLTELNLESENKK